MNEPEQSFLEKMPFDNKRKDVTNRRVQLNRRRGPGRRRTDDRKSAEEGQMSAEQFDFLMAIDQYKRENARPFPSWTEILELIKALGYRKVAEPQSIQTAIEENKETTNVPTQV